MLRKNYKNLSGKYHSSGDKQLTEREVASYLKARMPATYAALRSVLSEVSQGVPHKVQTFLDLGAGPGTGLLAGREFFPDIQKAILVEKNPHMIAKGKEVVDAEWIMEDVLDVKQLDMDLVLFSYSLGEMARKKEALQRAWEGAKTLVIIEPGTPKGFEVILEARRLLIEWGGQMIAPCPHMRKCPMEGKDWCHFSVRLERSKEHKQAKDASLGWEDEKFSYVAFSKEIATPAKGRIVRHPLKHKGYVVLQICGQEGLEKKTITKREKEIYKMARKIKWGARVDLDNDQNHTGDK